MCITLRAASLVASSLCFALPLLAGPSGEPPTGGPREADPVPVSLERVLELARERAPAIAAARARVIQAEGRRRSATSLPDPELTFGAGRGKSRESGSRDSEWSVELAQTLPSPWALRSRARSGAASIDAAGHEVDAATADVVLEAKRLYYRIAVAEARTQALAQASADAGAIRDIMVRRVDVGEAPEADRLRTQVEALRADLEARRATAQAEEARRALERFLLGALGGPFTVSTELDPLALPEAPEALGESAAEQDPSYRAALSRRDAARWSVAAERASRLPGLGVSLFREREIDRDATGATLGLTIPLWNRNRGALATARGEQAEADAEAKRLRAQIEAQIAGLVLRDRDAREAAVIYRREILPAATESLAIAKVGVEQGETGLIAWLEARRSYLETLRASSEAVLEAFQTRAELERLTGEIHASHGN